MTLIGTFNSAPVLPKVTRSVFQDSTEDSLDDFVVSKKPATKKKSRQPTKKYVAEAVKHKSGGNSQSSSEDPLSFGSPTPVFRKKDDTFDKYSNLFK